MATFDVKPSAVSVSARSKPVVQRGPVPIDVQKQVAAACVQLTAINERRGTAGRIDGIDVRSVAKDTILHLDGGQFAGPHAEKGITRRRLFDGPELPAGFGLLGLGDRHARGGNKKLFHDCGPIT